jgi:hypothetical protein
MSDNEPSLCVTPPSQKVESDSRSMYFGAWSKLLICMNDAFIREHFHRKRLSKHRRDPDTIVVDELGLKHGRCRADIAVINGHLVGYEIKSDNDSLRRLPSQLDVYSAVFDRASVIACERHADAVKSLIPSWWGLIIATLGPRDGAAFVTLQRAQLNGTVDPFSVAQLLWRDEAVSILGGLGISRSQLRVRRKLLYECLASELSIAQLRAHVRECLKARKNWRCPEPPPRGGDSSRPSAR